MLLCSGKITRPLPGLLMFNLLQSCVAYVGIGKVVRSQHGTKSPQQLVYPCCCLMKPGAPIYRVQFNSVQSLSRVLFFATPWIAACQASLSITNCWSLPKRMSIESVMPSNHLILCFPLLLLPSIFPNIRVFSNESALASGGQSIGVSASTSVLPMNTQDWSPLGWTGWISYSPRDSQESSPTPQFKSINSSALSFL